MVAATSRFLIVLDLDECLLHSFFLHHLTPIQQLAAREVVSMEDSLESTGTLSFLDRQFHCIELDSQTMLVTCLRPGVRTFLKNLGQKYDLAVWSAGTQDYVERMCALLFPFADLQPVFIFHREHCQPEDSPLEYTKPLSIPMRMFPHLDIRKTILVDNRAANGAHYRNLFVEVRPWLPVFSDSHALCLPRESESYLILGVHKQIEKKINHLQQALLTDDDIEDLLAYSLYLL